MALAALIFACREIEGGAGLAATLPIAGRTLLEYQARQATQAGARHIVVLVERLPAALITAIDRLRDDGIAVEIARTVGDAADRVHPDEMLLVVGDGVVAGTATFHAVASSAQAMLLTVTDGPDSQRFERIDADQRWSGLALLDGGRLRATAQMLGDWDLETTLVRRAVQERVTRVDANSISEASGVVAILPVFALEQADLASFERRAVQAGAGQSAVGWPERFIFPLIEKPVVPKLLNRIDEPALIAVGSTLCAAVAVPLTLLQWFEVALILAVISGPLFTIATRIAATRLSPLLFGRTISSLRVGSAGAALLALGYRLGDAGQWGWILLALIAIASALATASAISLLRRLRSNDIPWWAVTPDGMIWALIPFGFTRHFDSGLWVLTGYAVMSFGICQRLLWKQSPQNAQA